jgi:hypothetical protein
MYYGKQIAIFSIILGLHDAIIHFNHLAGTINHFRHRIVLAIWVLAAAAVAVLRLQWECDTVVVAICFLHQQWIWSHLLNHQRRSSLVAVVYLLAIYLQM